MKRLGHMAPVRDVFARILSASHFEVSNNPEAEHNISFLSNLDITSFANLSSIALKEFVDSQEYILTLAPLRSSCAGQTGLSVLNAAIETGQFENYRSRLNAYLNITDVKPRHVDELGFACQSLLFELHRLARSEPNIARIVMMATEQEINTFAGFDTYLILRFCSAGIVPFVFHEGSEDVMLHAIETQNFSAYRTHVERVRMKALTDLI